MVVEADAAAEEEEVVDEASGDPCRKMAAPGPDIFGRLPSKRRVAYSASTGEEIEFDTFVTQLRCNLTPKRCAPPPVNDLHSPENIEQVQN